MTTLLPPLTLARHYYETRRKVMEAAGLRATPWFRLTDDERAVAVAEASLINEALRRAERERAMLQDLAGTLSVPRRVRRLPLV